MRENDPVTVNLGLLFQQERDAETVLAARTASVDQMVTAAFAGSFSSVLSGTVAVAAVGGYGRKELFPYSDVDLLILTASDSHLILLQESLASFLRSLWDKGLRISHSTRTIADCCRFHPDNLELHISLLDLRYLAGSPDLCNQLQARLPETYTKHAPAIVTRLVKQARQRHARFNETPYHLEPNVKESPGGIRDIHLLRWLAQLQPEHQFLREAMFAWEGDEPQPKEWLFALRCFLHLRAGRDSNLLTFEMQDEAAHSLAPQPTSPEEWMRVYFQQARRIYQRSLRALEFSAGHDGSRLKKIFWTGKRKAGFAELRRTSPCDEIASIWVSLRIFFAPVWNCSGYFPLLASMEHAYRGMRNGPCSRQPSKFPRAFDELRHSGQNGETYWLNRTRD